MDFPRRFTVRNSGAAKEKKSVALTAPHTILTALPVGKFSARPGSKITTAGFRNLTGHTIVRPSRFVAPAAAVNKSRPLAALGAVCPDAPRIKIINTARNKQLDPWRPRRRRSVIKRKPPSLVAVNNPRGDQFRRGEHSRGVDRVSRGAQFITFHAALNFFTIV